VQNATCPSDNVFRTCYNGTGFMNTAPGLAEDEVLTNDTIYIATVINSTGNYTEEDWWECGVFERFEQVTILWAKKAKVSTVF
jgi:hypothetical protein